MAAGTAVGDMLLGDHLCLIYESEEERLAVLIAYVGDGLAAGHKVIYVADATGNPADGGLGGTALGGDRGARERRRGGDELDGVLARLSAAPGAAPLDLATAVAAGQLVIHQAGETGGGAEDEMALLGAEIDLALMQGYEGVRVTGETAFSLRGWPGSEGFAASERRCAGMLRTSGDARAMAICQYDRRWFDAVQLRELEACHAGRVRIDDLFDNGVLRITPTFMPPGLRLAGDLDESTLPGVEAALRRISGSDRGGHLCLDLSDLDFCDMEGLRALLGARRSGSSVDRHVILRGVPGYLELMMRIAGLEAMPGVVVEEAAR
ncbi:MEDS domain-containing protein [Actinomadura barringtoniae]|nr:MEDS domain-containing protein [Actinomadura barringtoniae]